MPSNTATAATANLSPRLARGNGRKRATSPATPATPAKKRRAAPGKPPATAADNKQLAALMEAAKSAPGTIMLDGKVVAIVLDARFCRQLKKLLRQLADQEEDRACIRGWRKAEKEGFVGPAKSAAFMREMHNSIRVCRI